MPRRARCATSGVAGGLVVRDDRLTRRCSRTISTAPHPPAPPPPACVPLCLIRQAAGCQAAHKLPTNAKCECCPKYALLPRASHPKRTSCCRAPATRSELADDHIGAKNQYEPADNATRRRGAHEGHARRRPAHATAHASRCGRAHRQTAASRRARCPAAEDHWQLHVHAGIATMPQPPSAEAGGFRHVDPGSCSPTEPHVGPACSAANR